MLMYEFFFFFFFQAEDGIRDGTVTGVQTCALPIYTICRLAFRDDVELVIPFDHERVRQVERLPKYDALVFPAVPVRTGGEPDRSEERRVGKECRSRWWADQ